MSDEFIECPNCDVELIGDAMVNAELCGYCPKCGEYLDPDDERNEPANEFADDECEMCGVEVDANCQFCEDCAGLYL